MHCNINVNDVNFDREKTNRSQQRSQNKAEFRTQRQLEETFLRK